MSDLFSSVNINSSFQRSARIDNKISSEFLDHFVFHDTSKKVLNQISSSLLNSNQSGFTLTGPYGTGKSSLALFLKALISKESVIKKQAESIANFNNNSGLKQIGNSTFTSTAASGDPELGEAAEDGFGNILSGSLERSNVDITEELVNLITAQRNYQAAAKAMETTTSMTQTIINIRL